MIRLGLTGSLAMGKSTIAEIFVGRGIPVHDCDAVVHDLYRPGGAAIKAVSSVFEGVLAEDGGIDRRKLGARVWKNAKARERLESMVHPLIAGDRADFLDRNERSGAALVVLDIPLLYETGTEREVDKVLVVTCSTAEQRRRAFERPGMTEARFAAIMAAQMADSEKRARADFVVDTETGRACAEQDLDRIIEALLA